MTGWSARVGVVLLAALLGWSCSDETPGTTPADGVGSPDSADGAGDATADPGAPDLGSGEPDEGPDTGGGPVGEGETGAPCNNSSDCKSGWCVEGESGDICTEACDNGACPEGFDCKAVQGGEELAFLCVPILKKLCTPCQEDFQCTEGACLALDGDTRCAYECGASGFTCPEGFACLPDPSGEREGEFCQPETGSCNCNIAFSTGPRSCWIENEAGVCYGTQACFGEEGWSACTAQTPEAESCDGEDNDCDGLIDQGLPEGDSCENTIEGVGSCSGVRICLGSKGWACVGPIPKVEACDAQDNNCDGTVDEGFTDAEGNYTQDEHCGVCGNDCTAQIANGTGECGGTPEAPLCVVAECDEGFIQAGDFQCLPPIDVGCQPCQNDASCFGGSCADLDGQSVCLMPCDLGCAEGFECAEVAGLGVDRCVPVTGTCSCTPATDGQAQPCSVANDFGSCTGSQVCDATVGWGPCDAKTPEAEDCDGADNDCNGLIDDGLPAQGGVCENTVEGVGTCPGFLVCANKQGWVCTGPEAQAETCDFLDNDCDGQTDEDFKDPAGAWTLDAHCGTCGNDCSTKFEIGTGVCNGDPVNPFCVVECEPPYVKLGDFFCTLPVDVSCAPCATDSDCFDGTCVEIDGQQVCAGPCAGDACKVGFQCTTITDGEGAQVDRCLPVSGSCTCSAATDGDTRICEVANAFGACLGLETCQADTGWVGCDAATPAVEQCNGADDNCNGIIDENVPPPAEPCQETNGFGTCVGTWFCADDGAEGVTWVCSAQVPADDVCDFQDNDCDGGVDEDFRLGGDGPYVDQDHCGSCGVSCDGAIPNATAFCAENGGTPRCEVQTCETGFFQAGPLTCLPLADSTCAPCSNDGQCGVPGDLCVALDGGSYCGLDCSAGNLHGTPEGECPAGFSCTDVAGGQQCLPDTGSCTCQAGDEGKTRTCTESNGFGTCFGTETCTASGWEGCDAKVPAAETCNGIDDDCEGTADLGLVPPATPCEKSNAFGTCAGGWVCGDPGGTGAVSWTCQAATPAEDLCDFLDNDCDGTPDQAYVDAATGLYLTDAHCGSCGISCVGAIPNATATCVNAGGVPRCEVASCAAGYYQAGPLTCLPVTSDLCTPCETDANCPTPGDACLDLDGAKFCGQDCSAGNLHGFSEGECPAGFVCQDFAAGVSQCVPDSGSCTCLAGDAGKTRTCIESNAVGTCYGQETCDPTSGWEGCTALVPADEVCNGVDDDCNAAIDDVPGRGAACTNDNAFGSCEGILDCTDAGPALVCVGPQPAAESCNYQDDNCDGATDEGFDDLFTSCSAGDGICQRFGFYECLPDGSATACNAVAGAGEAEVCDGLDNDCNGQTDESALWGDKLTPCTLGEGICQATGIKQCDASNPSGPTVCDATPGTPGTEICDGLDNNCDGDTDENPLWADKNTPCIVGQGLCQATGVLQCDGSSPSGALVCSAQPGTPQNEVCDGLDNDCDGAADNGPLWTNKGQPCVLGEGICQATGIVICDPANDAGPTICSATPGTPDPVDVCDGLDNDCDGDIDNVVAPACPLQQGVCAGSTQICAGAGGFLACSALNYGVDYEPTEVSCDGLDNDCNGITDDVDLDQDGHIAQACGGDDCNDLNPLVYTGAPEICGDGLDNDCNGTAEDLDGDGDGYVAVACGGDDCNDGTGQANPAQSEVCGDGLDNDCDGSIDNKDFDGDGFLDPACGGVDCDDTLDFVKPGGIEACNTFDDDCNGITDDKDTDGDGYIDDHPICGGDDCDDDEVLINPGAGEICGNSADEDCSGAIDDKDSDNDTYIDDNPLCAGGSDCDDTDPLVFPGADEIYDTKDTDCNGLVDEGLIPPGSIIITEIMKNPNGVGDTVGEWFELTNVWTFPVNVNSWDVADADGDAFQIVSGGPILLNPGGTTVLCANANFGLNGGVLCSYDYDNFQLAQDPDEIIISLAGVEIDRVAYTNSFPNTAGRTLSLDPNQYSSTANDAAGNWCNAPNDAANQLASGDYGTPNQINPSCTGAPAVTSVNPNNGVDDGGTQVVIVGSGFIGANDVSFGGTSCASFTVVDDNTIQCTTPPKAAGSYGVTVTKGAQNDTLPNGFTFTGEAVSAIDWCDLQFPSATTAQSGVPSELIYGQVHSPGVTEPAGAPSGIIAQVGYGPLGSDPRNQPGWTWTNAVWHAQFFANDEFRQTLTIAVDGIYSYAYRFTDDGGTNYMYCDFDPGTADGFFAVDTGTITVE